MTLHLNAGLLKETYARFSADKAPRLAASLSYTTIFAIAPLFIIVIAIAGYAIGVANGTGHGHHVIEDKLLAAVQSSAGKGAADAVRDMVKVSFDKPRQSIVAQVIGWITLVLGAAGLFAALQDALNTVWHVEPPKKGIWPAIRDRIASIGMLLAIGFILLVTTAVNAAVAYVSTYVATALPFPGAGIVFGLINLLVSIAVIALLFAVMFKYLPDAKVEWGDVRTGALVTAVLFVIGQAAISLYIGKAGVASAYGAAGSLLVLLLWVYYSSMILLFGAEFTRVYAEKHGSRIGAAPSDVDPNAKKSEDPKPARVATERGDVRDGEAPAPAREALPRGSGRPL
ncbi:MAG TPA: YihY/virulence factor BrkB family protein [Candidatus Elarobacter sp.]|nr:YihY/virulence factor BrkB family protein [Dongiaceae bacterium]HZW53663.1 YihY/virulence factor BrkB family protein [Candidatus Elarobacter sp.]